MKLFRGKKIVGIRAIDRHLSFARTELSALDFRRQGVPVFSDGDGELYAYSRDLAKWRRDHPALASLFQERIRRRCLFGKKLVGRAAINNYLGLTGFFESAEDWRLTYGLPVFRENGQWCAYVSDLKKWRREHPGVREEFPDPLQITTQTIEPLKYTSVPLKTRWRTTYIP